MPESSDTEDGDPLGQASTLRSPAVNGGTLHQGPWVLGPYRLLQLLGEGGMGEVWQAEQLAPVRRTVAVKVIKAGMDTRQVVARFETERQALALMDHPSIAKVFDGGSTAQGRPYFVMEYVRGVPINEHCADHHLPIAERLALFAEVCAGVQHAHQKAVIHRDLKPSNLLVALVDGRPQPKIIDFGIAKATGCSLTRKTLFTELGAVIGTPEYMSPEQADLSAQDIDTRTDVYSLGVVLYELLTGVLPFSSEALRVSNFGELRRILREVEPPKPSFRVLAPLRKQLQGDLDAITMKALSKERDRRYSTPLELAADLGRYVGNEPVLARPPSKVYQLQRYVRRHRLAVAVTLGLLLMLLAFAALMTVQARRMAFERDRANEERNLALTWANHARDLSRSPADLSNFLMPSEGDPDFAIGVFAVRARNLREHGDLQGAERLARDAVELAHRLRNEDTLYSVWARNEHSQALLAQGRLAEAEVVLRQTLPIGRRVLGANFPMVGWTTLDLAHALLWQGKREELLVLLTDALDSGLFDVRIAGDPALASLRDDPRFAALAERMEHRYDLFIQRAVESVASIQRVPSDLVRAIIKAESNFNPDAASDVGAVGLMMVMPFNAAKVSVSVTELSDPEMNILAGTRLLAVLLKYYDGSTTDALIAYDRPRPLFEPVPQNGETPDSVASVLKYFREYSEASVRKPQPEYWLGIPWAREPRASEARSNSR